MITIIRLMYRIYNRLLKSIKEMKGSNQKHNNKIIKYFNLDVRARLRICTINFLKMSSIHKHFQTRTCKSKQLENTNLHQTSKCKSKSTQMKRYLKEL